MAQNSTFPDGASAGPFLMGNAAMGTGTKKLVGSAFCTMVTQSHSVGRFLPAPRGLIANFLGESDQKLYEAQDIGEDMVCLGPEVGV